MVSLGSGEGAQVEVPNVVDKDEATAKNLLGAAGLSSSASTAASDTVSEGNIISQNPVAGTKVDPGSRVTYVVSTGPDSVYIGNAEKNGSSESAVTAYLRDRGLNVSRTEEYSDTVPAGDVISYSPGNGSTVEYGSTVNIVVSKGPEPIATAEVPGAGADVTEITNRGFQVGNISKEYSDSIVEGKIISCSPSGTQNVGTKIDVVVSLGVWLHPNVGTDGVCAQCGKTGLTPTVPVNGGSGSGNGGSTGNSGTGNTGDTGSGSNTGDTGSGGSTTDPGSGASAGENGSDTVTQ